jgi:hypothetical protein
MSFMRTIAILLLIFISNCSRNSNDSSENDLIVAALAVASQQQSLPTSIYIYSIGNPINGAFGNRAAADSLCENRKNNSTLSAKLTGKNSRAFISLSSSDEIRGFPESYGLPVTIPIKAPNGVIVAENWRDFLDGNLAISLVAANVIRDPNVTRIWTFSNLNGAFNNSNNCSSGSSTVGNGTLWEISSLSYTLDTQLCSNSTAVELLCFNF